jgi:nitrate reductase NapE component
LTKYFSVPSPASLEPRKSKRSDSDSFSKDAFSFIVYALVTIAMLGQVGWILWMEYMT